MIMPPAARPADPKPPADPPKTGTPPPDPAPPPTEQRFERIEAEQQRQGGILEQILGKLGGGSGSPEPSKAPAPAADPDSGKSVAELVREGVEKLEAEKAAKARAETEAAERRDHAERIKRLEEAAPREVAVTAPGRVRGAIQRWGFGLDQPGR